MLMLMTDKPQSAQHVAPGRTDDRLPQRHGGLLSTFLHEPRPQGGATVRATALALNHVLPRRSVPVGQRPAVDAP